MRRIRSHLTYANVMVTLLAFVVLAGGTAFAANTVFSTDIVDGEVKAPTITHFHASSQTGQLTGSIAVRVAPLSSTLASCSFTMDILG